jgi:ribonuclease HI
MKDLHHLQGNQRSLAIHTDSRISQVGIANPSNHQNLVEGIREEIRRLDNDNWIIHFTWVKAHDDNYGNELADRLAKEAACSNDVDIAYIKIPKSAVTSALKEKGVQLWQSDWDASNKGELQKRSSLL